MEVKLCFLEANFNFRKWRTNDPDLQAFFDSQEDIDARTHRKDGGGKVLGVQWDEVKDELIIFVSSFVRDAEKLVPTKRNILKLMAGIFDPLGFIQNFVSRSLRIWSTLG